MARKGRIEHDVFSALQVPEGVYEEDVMVLYGCGYVAREVRPAKCYVGPPAIG